MKTLKSVMIALALTSLSAKASITINFDIGEITSGGSLVSSGTFLFISHGTNNVLNSGNWTSGSSFLQGDDLLMGAFSISNGTATSALPGYVSPAGYGSTQFTGFFINGLTASDVDYSTGTLLNSKEFGNSGTSYNFGSYRTGLIEGFFNGPSGNMAWVIPPVGSALSLWAYTNTDLGGSGLYTGAEITANLATSASFNIVPEPSTGALLMIGAAGLVALRRLRKV